MPVKPNLEKEKIEQLLKEKKLSQIRALTTPHHPADLADLLDELTLEEAVALFEQLPVDVASEVLDETRGFARRELVDQIGDEQLADILDELPMDDAAEFLEDLPLPLSDRLLDLMEPEEAADVRQILSFGKYTAGRLMTTDVAVLQQGWTVAETIAYLRSLQEAEILFYLYVVDDDHKLIGVVPIRPLLMAQPDERIENLVRTKVISIPATADQEELAHAIAKYDYLAIPVVDEANHLLGVVTVDDALDVLEEEATEDIQRLGGSQPLEQPYFAISTSDVFKKRIGWLLLLFAAGALTGFVTRVYEDVWGTFLALASFVPLIIGTGGNSGSQTIATIIRAITVGEVKFSNIGPAWRREISVGLLLGLVMGGLGLFLAIFLWDARWEVALAVALTLPMVVIWSMTVGTIVPILADRLNIDPAVISGPMITTIVDVTGLVIYYTLAGLILGVYSW